MKRILLALGMLVLPLLGWAQSCPFWQEITFMDSGKACLNQFTLSRQPAAGFGRAVETMIPPVGLYALAASMGEAASCPLVVGLSAEVLGGSVAFASGPEQVRRREEISLRACENALAAQKVPADCTCKNVVTDGRSLVARQAFDARFAERAGVASLPVAAAPAPAKPAPVPAAPSAAVAAPAVPPGPLPVPAVVPTAPSPGIQAPRLSAHALVIGNSKYASFGALANPVRDAKAIADKLKSFGIPVDLLLDAQRDDLIHALNEHSRRAAGKDLSILFYAGHGVQVEGTNYLIPVNMRADGLSAGYVKLAGISLNATLDYMPGKTRLIFLDACRDNPAVRALVSSRSTSAPGLAPVNAASGTLFSFATRDGATAADGDGLNSPYTTALLQHLDKPMDISLVLRQVRQTVLQLTGGRQEPWEYGSLVGDQIVLPLMARPAN